MPLSLTAVTSSAASPSRGRDSPAPKSASITSSCFARRRASPVGSGMASAGPFPRAHALTLACRRAGRRAHRNRITQCRLREPVAAVVAGAAKYRDARSDPRQFSAAIVHRDRFTGPSIRSRLACRPPQLNGPLRPFPRRQQFIHVMFPVYARGLDGSTTCALNSANVRLNRNARATRRKIIHPAFF